MSDNKYTNGKIYSIRCYCDDSLVYYGSTINNIECRFQHHKFDFRNRDTRNKITSFIIMEKPDCYVKLEELFPCENITQLRAREAFYIKNNPCVNKQIPNRTSTQYRVDTKEHISEVNKNYYQDNIDKIEEYRRANSEKQKLYFKQRYEDKKDEILTKQKERYENNKEAINAKRNQQGICEDCGKSYTHSNKSRHLQSEYHLKHSNK